MSASKAKRPAARAAVDDALAGTSERVLKQITELYEAGLSGPRPGSLGLQQIAENPLLDLQIRKPRKKISVMIIGNHSAGKSSFINWYIGEQIQKTGVAIETRGFTFVTSGRKRETLAGDATLYLYDYLDDFGKIEGIVPNLFTEISTSKEKNFSCVDFVDTPGLVDGDMQYPFNVQDAIVAMADHVDLILIFFDPIGQATCRRTMQVVERLNNGPHAEKIQYFMSKADAVEKEHDRQRVLIQITQNLATKIRNSHAFNLPTFYLERPDAVPLAIPNAIQDVCQEINKAIDSTVQKNLKQLKQDCARILERINEARERDRADRARKASSTTRGVLLYLLAFAAFAALLVVMLARFLPLGCELVNMPICSNEVVLRLGSKREQLSENFNMLAGVAGGLAFVLCLAAQVLWRPIRVLNKKELAKLQDFQLYVTEIAAREKGLYLDYLASLAPAEGR